MGEGNYLFDYYLERRTDRNLQDPHSVVFRLIAEAGVVGILGLIAFVVGVGVAVAGRWRSAPDATRWWSSALLAAGAVGLAQASVDWIWLIPGVLGITFLTIGLGVASLRDGPDVGRRAPMSLAGRLAVALALVAIAGVTATVYLGDVYVRKARAAPPDSPGERLSSARSAQRLLPWSVTPRYLAAGALEQLGRTAAARAELDEALRLEPENFVTHGLLGDLAVREEDLREARAHYRRALALNPRDEGLQELSKGEIGGP